MFAEMWEGRSGGGQKICLIAVEVRLPAVVMVSAMMRVRETQAQAAMASARISGFRVTGLGSSGTNTRRRTLRTSSLGDGRSSRWSAGVGVGTGGGRGRGWGCAASSNDEDNEGDYAYYSEEKLKGEEVDAAAGTSPRSSQQDPAEVAKPGGRWAAADEWLTSIGGGSGGSGGSGSGGGGGGEGEEGEEGEEGDDSGLLPLEECEKLLAKGEAAVPEDWQALAKLGGGLRQSVLTKYLALLKGGGALSFLVAKFPVLRDRLIEDDRFLFKVFTEVLIDSGCATFAEVKKRGDVFWDEFEFYLSDLVVGIFLDVALVTLLAPTCAAGAAGVVAKVGKTKGLGRAANALLRFQKSLPSAVFEKSIKGVRVYTPKQRAIAFLYKGFEYAAVGFACGLVGQSMANTAMIAKRAYSKSKRAEAARGSQEASMAALGDGGSDLQEVMEEVPVPPLFRTALVWALFMGVSSNTRYQVVFGLERLVEGTVLAQKVPMIANVATVAIRFANNIYGGEQFIDMARWAGVQ